MTRLFCVAIIVAAVSLAAPVAWASVPDPGYSTVGWVNVYPAYADSTVMICPAGDASYIQVNVRDQFNAPMGGVLVQASFSSGNIYLVSPVEGNTDTYGDVTLTISGGIDNTGGETSITSATTVTCLGVTLYSNDRDFLSPDMTQATGSENKVEGLDYSIFAGDWLSFNDHSRSNFNRLCNESGGECVGGLDYSIFALHWLH
ncbi:MAG: hypothetical protein AMJ46_00880 [Latescibacteria bacterium DG_63]|nr:MAG: hypothetical protein AMJ46_00880 [Latescibacteria bacterium DG_63]